MTIQKKATIIIWIITNILKRDYNHLTILGTPPVSSKEDDSLIISPMLKINDSTKITCN